LKRAESDDPIVRCEEALRVAGFATPNAMSLASQIGVRPSEAEALLDMMAQDGLLVDMPGGLKVHPGTIETIERRALAYLNRHHANQPAEIGLQRDRFLTWIDKRSTKGFGKEVCRRLLKAGTIREQGPYVAHKDFQEPMSPEDAAAMEKIVAELEAAGFDPPEWVKLKATAGLSKQRLRMLEDLAKCDARLAPLAPGKWIAASAVEKAKETVRRLGDGRRFKLAEVRDALNLSRRVVQPLLEYLDRIQFTRRVGDERVLQESGR
jgi:selenocysteine-specific elongation factor